MAFIEANKTIFLEWCGPAFNAAALSAFYKICYIILGNIEIKESSSLREKCPYLGFSWSVFSRIWLNAGKCGPEKFRIRTLFTKSLYKMG